MEGERHVEGREESRESLREAEKKAEATQRRKIRVRVVGNL